MNFYFARFISWKTTIVYQINYSFMSLFLIRNSSSQSDPLARLTIYSCYLLFYFFLRAISIVCLAFIAQVNFIPSYLELGALIFHFFFAPAHTVLVVSGSAGILSSEARSRVLFCTMTKLLKIFLKILLNTRFFSPMPNIFPLDPALLRCIYFSNFSVQFSSNHFIILSNGHGHNSLSSIYFRFSLKARLLFSNS